MESWRALVNQCISATTKRANVCNPHAPSASTSDGMIVPPQQNYGDTLIAPKGPVPYPMDAGWPKAPFANVLPLTVYPSTLATVFINYISPEFTEKFTNVAGNKDLTMEVFDPPMVTLEDGKGRMSKRTISYSKKLQKTPLTSLIGLPDYASVTEHQSVHVSADGKNAYLETASKVAGVPYSNCFDCTSRILFYEIGPQSVQCDIELDIVWHKGTLLKGKIESTTIQEWKDTSTIVKTVLSELIGVATIPVLAEEKDEKKKLSISINFSFLDRLENLNYGELGEC